MRLNELPEDMRTAIMSSVGITDDAQTVADAVIGGIILSACGGSAPMVRLLLDTIGESADVRLREREVKLKEKSLDDDRADGAASITFVFEREETA